MIKFTVRLSAVQLTSPTTFVQVVANRKQSTMNFLGAGIQWIALNAMCAMRCVPREI